MDGPEPALRSRPALSRQDATAAAAAAAGGVNRRAPSYPPPPLHVHHLPPAAAAAGAPPPPENNPERWIVIDGILFAYNATVVMGIDLKALFDGWGTAAKVAYGVAMAAAASSLGLGLMAASCAYMMRNTSSHSQGLYRKISASCARFGAILSTVLFVICISSSVGRLGWIGGIFFSAVVAGSMAGIWIWGRQVAAEAVPLS